MNRNADAATHVFYATKGLNVVPISRQRYVVQDALGHSSLPHPYRDFADLDSSLRQNFGVSPLVPVEEQHPLSSFPSFRWQQLEHWYTTHLDYALEERLNPKDEDKARYSAELYALPLAYLEFGYGDGSRDGLEYLDKQFRKLLADGKVPVSAVTLERWLALEQCKRIFRELMSLIHRAIVSFLDLLSLQRACVREASSSLIRLKANEVVHHGRESYRASTAATMAAISLCTSLDIQSKLVHYLDQLLSTPDRFKPAGGRHFSDLRKFKPRHLPHSIHKDFLGAADANKAIAELIQFRHDVVHSTSALELEKVYVGFGTPEVNEFPLHYAFQGWRDCTDSGQPERYLGREFFTERGSDMEQRVFTWIHDVIGLHIDSGARIHAYLVADHTQAPPRA